MNRVDRIIPCALLLLVALTLGAVAVRSAGYNEIPREACVPARPCRCVVSHDWRTDSPIVRVEADAREELPVASVQNSDSNGDLFLTLHTIANDGQARDMLRAVEQGAHSTRVSHGSYNLFITRAGAPQDTAHYVVTYSEHTQSLEVEEILSQQFIVVEPARRLPDGLMCLLVPDVESILPQLGELGGAAEIVAVKPGLYLNLPFEILSFRKERPGRGRRRIAVSQAATGDVVFFRPATADSAQIDLVLGILGDPSTMTVVNCDRNQQVVEDATSSTGAKSDLRSTSGGER